MKPLLILCSVGCACVVALIALLHKRADLEDELSVLEGKKVSQIPRERSVQRRLKFPDRLLESLYRAEGFGSENGQAQARLPVLAGLGELSEDQLKLIAQEILKPDQVDDPDRERQLRKVRDEVLMVISEFEPQWVLEELQRGGTKVPSVHDPGHDYWMTAFTSLTRKDESAAIEHFERLEFDAIELTRHPVEEAANLTFTMLVKNQPERALKLYLVLDKLGWHPPSIATHTIQSPEALRNYEKEIVNLPAGESRMRLIKFLLPAACRMGGVQEAFTFLEAVAQRSEEGEALYHMLGSPDFYGPDKAGEVVAYLRKRENSPRLINAYVAGWAWHDLDSPGDWVRTLPPGPDRDAAVTGLVSRCQERAPQLISEFLPLIRNDELRERYEK